MVQAGFLHQNAVVRNLNRGQRIVGVLAWGLVLWFVGSYVTTLGEGPAFGWVAYAPLSKATRAVTPGPDLTALESLLLSLALVAFWGIGSYFLLRSPSTRKEEPSD
jgi:heme/copper-type cytochrome/quinol oxidase subunit 1